MTHVSSLRLSLLVVLTAIALSLTNGYSQATITVDTTVKYQTIDGWEFTGRTWAVDKTNNKYDSTYVLFKERVCDSLVDMGVNRIRLSMASGAENPVDYFTQFVANQITYTGYGIQSYCKINDNSDPNVINPAGFQWAGIDWEVDNIILPMKQRLAARGEQLYINLLYGDFNGGNQGTLSHAANPAEYAELFSAAFQHLKTKYNITPDAIEISLEPENTAAWNDGNALARAILAVVPRLNADGFFPKEIIAPSCTNLQQANYVFGVMKNNFPAVLQKMTTICYHRYGGVTPANLQTMADNGQTYGLKTAMGEWLAGSNITLMEDLKLVNVSFWQQWGLVTKTGAPANYYLVADFTNPTDPQIKRTAYSNLLQQFFRYIRLGAVRVNATSTNATQYNPVAFKNTNGRYAVVVNNSSATPFTITGLPAGTYGITYSSGTTTTVTASHVSLPDVTIAAGGSITANGGAVGAVTIYGKPGGTSISAGPAPEAPVSLEIFPNPFSNRVTFMMSHVRGNEASLLEIYDLSGRKVKAVSAREARHLTLSKDGLVPGAYIYKFYANGNLLKTGKLLLL